MDQRQFEQAILQMIHTRRVERLTPSAVAYEFGMSVKDAEKALDRMVTGETLELDSDDDGNLFYFLPGLGTAGVFMQGTAAANPSEAPTPPNGPGQPYPGMQGAGPSAPWSPPPATPPYASSTHPGPAPSGPPPSHNPYATGAGAAGQGGYPPPQGAYGQNPYGQGQAPGYGQPPNQTGYGNAGPYGNTGYGQPPTAPPPSYASHQGAPQGYGQPSGYAPTQSGYPPQYPQPSYGNAYNAPNAGGPPYANAPYGYGQQALVPVSSTPRSAAAASLLSAMFPGAGQLYNGQVGKGLFFFFSTVVMLNFGPLAMLPWLWGVVDAYSTTRRTNTQAYGLLPHQP